MENGLDLKAFLESQSSEGVVDSKGAFTVAREKALKKLASFALPGEYDWVLKVVQAVNVWGAPRLVVRQSRVATSFYFCPPAGSVFPSESAIVGALESVALDRDDPVHQLAMALRSLVEQCQLSFVLAVRQHGATSKPIYAGADISGLDSHTRESWTQMSSEGVRLTVSHFKPNESLTGRYIPTFSKQARRDVHILTTLSQRCFASAVPVEVDSRPVSLVFPRGDYYQSHRLRPLILGRLDPELATAQVQPVSARLPRENLTVSASPERRGTPWFLLTGPDWKTVTPGYDALANALQPLDRPTEVALNTVYWVRHGVTVKGFRILGQVHDLSLSLFLPGEQLRTDLGGLQVDNSLDATAMTSSALKAISDALADQLANGQALRTALTAAPEKVPTNGESASRENVEKAGESAFSRSIAIELPTIGLGVLALLNRATALLEHLPLHDRRLATWADLVEKKLGLLRDKLQPPATPKLLEIELQLS